MKGGGGYVIVVREERGRVRARRYVVAGDTLVEGGSAPMTYRTVRKCIGVCVRTANISCRGKSRVAMVELTLYCELT